MATTNEYGFFFDSENGDRVYSADSFSDWLKRFFANGVFDGDLQVTAMTGMNVSVNSGYAFINGKLRIFKSAQVITIPVASGTYPRIDTIVVRLDTQERQITCEHVQGLYSGLDPQPQAPVRENGIYELVLAQIYVDAGVTEINATNITDTRADENLCGWIASTIRQLSVQQLLDQAKARFDDWFDNTREKLDGDVAGHLQNEIDDLQDDVNGLESETTFTVLASNWSSTTVVVDGQRYYTNVFTLNHVYNTHPIIGVGANGTVPTVAEQKAYDLFKYAVIDDANLNMTLYSLKRITNDFIIVVKGVD